MGDNTFLPKAIEIVKQAVRDDSLLFHLLEHNLLTAMVLAVQVLADQEDDFEKALTLYKKSLEYFMTGTCNLMSYKLT